MEISAYRASSLETRMSKPRVVASILVVLVVALSGVGACGGSAPEAPAPETSAPDSYFAEWPRGGTPGIPGVKGVIELLLFDSGSGDVMFRASAMAEGDGLKDNGLYSLWLTNQQGTFFLVDSSRADQECDEDPDTGEETDDCEIEVHLRSPVQPSPMQITSLLGLTATIREGGGSIFRIIFSDPSRWEAVGNA